MVLPSSGQISFANINTELARSSIATLGLQEAETGVYATLNTNSASRPNGSAPYSMNEWYSYNHAAAPAAPTPEYWWRADSGLSTSGWTAYNGGLNFTFSGVSSANSSTGVLIGPSAYGATSNVPSTISARHIFIRHNSLSVGSGSLLGGSFYGIHEFLFAASYIVEGNGSGSYTYAAQSGGVGSQLTWVDLVNSTAPRLITDANNWNSGNNLSVYAGSYTNRFWWPSGNILLGIRQNSLSGDGGYASGYIKEIAIFTTSLTAVQAQAFQSAILARWP